MNENGDGFTQTISSSPAADWNVPPPVRVAPPPSPGRVSFVHALRLRLEDLAMRGGDLDIPPPSPLKMPRWDDVDLAFAGFRNHQGSSGSGSG